MLQLSGGHLQGWDTNTHASIRPEAFRGAGVNTFLKGLPLTQNIQRLFGYQALQLAVLPLKRLQPFGITDRHTAVFGPPAIERLRGNAISTAKLRWRTAGLSLFQAPKNPHHPEPALPLKLPSF
jgi:hypothetical protein